jgi:CDP-paratose 2-epimerase
MNILITGGLGFIGINTTLRYVNKADNIILFDNLNKVGSLDNLKLVRDYPNVKFIKGDLRNYNDVQGGQTAVTTSLENPKMDFESNASGTFNILECMREYTPEAKLIFTSTNKVYGNLNGRDLTESSKRYVFTDNISGIDETENLDFYSPYGCSKGAADQYVRD